MTIRYIQPRPYLGTLISEAMNFTIYVEAYLSFIIMHSDSLHGGQEYRRSNAFSLFDQYGYALKQEPLPRGS